MYSYIFSPPNNDNYRYYPYTERLMEFAVTTGAVAAEIKNVPNQPLKFKARQNTPFYVFRPIAKSFFFFLFCFKVDLLFVQNYR